MGPESSCKAPVHFVVKLLLSCHCHLMSEDWVNLRAPTVLEPIPSACRSSVSPICHLLAPSQHDHILSLYKYGFGWKCRFISEKCGGKLLLGSGFHYNKYITPSYQLCAVCACDINAHSSGTPTTPPPHVYLMYQVHVPWADQWLAPPGMNEMAECLSPFCWYEASQQIRLLLYLYKAATQEPCAQPSKSNHRRSRRRKLIPSQGRWYSHSLGKQSTKMENSKQNQQDKGSNLVMRVRNIMHIRTLFCMEDPLLMHLSVSLQVDMVYKTWNWHGTYTISSSTSWNVCNFQKNGHILDLFCWSQRNKSSKQQITCSWRIASSLVRKKHILTQSCLITTKWCQTCTTIMDIYLCQAPSGMPKAPARTLDYYCCQCSTELTADPTKDTFYDQMDTVIKSISTLDNLIILGDMNAVTSVSHTGFESVIGLCGSGTSNDNTLHLITLSAVKNLSILYSWFKLHGMAFARQRDS